MPSQIGSGSLPVDQLPSVGLAHARCQRQGAAASSRLEAALRALPRPGDRPHRRRRAVARPALPRGVATKPPSALNCWTRVARMIVATAGHIDHGKTTLVRALTGVDTDRLPEEKARGISIDLGYAYTPLRPARSLGFVDVPGHERFVRNMLAGVCGIDFALLVVAADDGVMPQTREHLAILDLLGISRGAVALTKIDRVDGERVREVRARRSTALLAATPLRGAPVFPVNATRAGRSARAALRSILHERASDMPARHDERSVPPGGGSRLHARGHGTIVTGTVFSGQVASATRAGDAAGTPVARAQHPCAEPRRRTRLRRPTLRAESRRRREERDRARRLARASRGARADAAHRCRLAPAAQTARAARNVVAGARASRHRALSRSRRPAGVGASRGGRVGPRSIGLRHANLCPARRSLHRARCAGRAHHRRRHGPGSVGPVAQAALGRAPALSRAIERMLAGEGWRRCSQHAPHGVSMTDLDV